MSTLSAFPFIGEQSFATPGAINSPLSIISANIAAVNAAVGGFSGVTISPPSGNTITITSALSITGQLQSGPLHTDGPIRIDANSNLTNYLYLSDVSNLRSDYIIGSQVGGTADGLNIWDDSGQTMIASFSKQSIRFFQQVVGPVFDVGGALADTLNAATFGSGTDSLESRIQAAISAASIANISRVYLPATMVPYSAASVSFATTVQMLREGGRNDVADVLAYGAYADDGAHDDIASFTAAAAWAGAQRGSSVSWIYGIVYVPPGIYRISSPVTLANQVRLLGATRRGARVAPTTGFTGRAVVTSEVGGGLIDAAVEQIEIGIDKAGVNGIYFDTAQQRSYIRDVLVNGGGTPNIGGYGIKLDSTGTATIQIGPYVNDTWVVNPGDHCLIIGPGTGVQVSAFHGENMPAGKASIYINGGTYISSGRHYIDGVHHEALVSGTTIVSLTTAAFCTVENIYSAAGSNVTGVQMDGSAQGTVLLNIAGTVVDSNSIMSRALLSASGAIPFYAQSAENLGVTEYGTLYGVRFVPQVRTTSVGGTFAPDCNLGSIYYINTLFNNSTITVPTNGRTGQTLTMEFVQSGGGPFTVAWNSIFSNSWSDAGNVAGARAVITHWFNGTRWDQLSYTPYAGYVSHGAGSALAPTSTFTSDLSLGWYRSGVQTIAQSIGTLNLATNAVRLSMRTIAASALTASAANTNVAVNECVFTVSASGASFAINSGGTTWVFNSDASAKNT